MLTRLPSTGFVLATAFFLVVVLVRTTQPLLDGDVWWHLRAGETILADRAIPSADSWTIAGAGLPWVSQDWLSNVVVASAFHSDDRWGTTLLSLVFGAIALGAFAVLWGAIGRRRPSSSTIGRVLSLGAGIVVAGPVLGVRVQTVDLLMIASTVWLLWGYLADRRARWLIGLPVLTIVWANTHAGWPMLFALGGAVVVGELVDGALKRHIDPRGPLSGRQIAAMMAALAVSVPALILNPNGARLLEYPFTTAGIDAHRDFLFEWSPPDVGTFPGQALLGFIGLVVLPTLVFAHRRLRAAEMLWLGGLSVLALSAVRFVIAIGPVGAAVAAVALAPTLADRGWLRSDRLVRILDQSPTSRTRGYLNLALVCLIGAGGLGVAAARVSPFEQQAAVRAAMPVQATAWLKEARPVARIFNVYAWGGYIGRELPESVVYIDGRSDIYGDGPIREYAEAIALERDPFEILDREHINVVVFWPDTAFSAALDQHTGWGRVYDNGQAAIWFRSESG